MNITSLSSGSNGNCYYIENNKAAILVDAGISRKQIVNRMSSLNLNPEKIRAIFITHEHSDHTRGADVFSRLYNIPIFTTKKTAENCFLTSNTDNIQIIKNNETTNISGFEIQAFSKSHNAADPVSFSITNNKTITIATDLGFANKALNNAVSNSNFLCIESNHDINMLENGKYPFFLKQWIKSDTGHLSNTQASLCVLEYATPELKHIMLSHLSENNNTPLLALQTFSNLLKHRKDLNAKISIASRYKETQLFKI